MAIPATAYPRTLPAGVGDGMPVGTGQVLVSAVIPLAVPALKVSRIVASVVNLTCQTLTNAVEVSGVLLETITQVSLGTEAVVDQVAAVPFTTSIPVPGATPGEVCQVTRVEVEGITVQFIDDQHIRQVTVIALEAATQPGLFPLPQPTSPPFEARPPGVFVARAKGNTFSSSTA
jgi:hypothetical protein